MRQNIFDEDFRDFIESLNAAAVEYILVGSYSVILHGYYRATGDMDIWVKPTADNYRKMTSAFNHFGMSLFDLNEARFLDTSTGDVFTFGRPPSGIDIMTMVKGLDFDMAFENSEWFQTTKNLKVRSLCLADLLTAKKAANRSKDKNDIENLTKKKKK